MKHTVLIPCLLFSLNAFAQNNSDSVAIVNLLMDDYKTMGTWDIKTHMNNCTDNYLLVENGEIWDIKKESEYYKANTHRIIDRKDYFDMKYVRISGNTAYAVYDLKSDIADNGIATTKTWLETVFFRKVNGQWKIELIHSTPTEVKK